MEKSCLYIVSTPIGNLQDITQRALETLKSVDLVICEDTRVTGNLLHHFEIKKKMVALNEFNENTVAYELVHQISSGLAAALVSDNGTPLISDPGYRLVNLAKEKQIPVIPIPGPSAVTAALSASGLPTNSLLFVGFPLKNKGKRKSLFVHLKNSLVDPVLPTIVMYESPHRVLETIMLIYEIWGDIELCVARELTKMHEDIRTQLASLWIDEYSKAEPKGEITLLFSSKRK